MRRPILLTVALTFALAHPANANEEITWYDEFQLWNDCQPMGLAITVHDDEDKVNLTEDTVTVAVRSRLRSARIYKTDIVSPYLSVYVHVVGAAYSIDINYRKRVIDARSGGLEGFATTWEVGSTGTHGNNSAHVMSWVSQYTDQFIDEYLRVNADACQ